MPANTYSPGEITTVGDLEVGDTIFLRERKPQAGGLIRPTTPAVVTALEPAVNGTVLVHVRNAGATTAIPERALGHLPASREFRLAVVGVPATPAAPTQNANVVTIPSSAAFTYRDDEGTVLAAGAHTITADLHVTALPKAGYVLASGATAAWTFTFGA